MTAPILPPLLHEVERQALVIALREHPEWTLQDLFAQASSDGARAAMLRALTLGELMTPPPGRPVRLAQPGEAELEAMKVDTEWARTLLEPYPPDPWEQEAAIQRRLLRLDLAILAVATDELELVPVVELPEELPPRIRVAGDTLAFEYVRGWWRCASPHGELFADESELELLDWVAQIAREFIEQRMPTG